MISGRVFFCFCGMFMADMGTVFNNECYNLRILCYVTLHI